MNKEKFLRKPTPPSQWTVSSNCYCEMRTVKTKQRVLPARNTVSVSINMDTSPATPLGCHSSHWRSSTNHPRSPRRGRRGCRSHFPEKEAEHREVDLFVQGPQMLTGETDGLIASHPAALPNRGRPSVRRPLQPIAAMWPSFSSPSCTWKGRPRHYPQHEDDTAGQSF